MTGKNKEMPVKKRFLKFPHIGMRLYKSAIGVFLCFLIYLIRGKQGTPFYSAIFGVFRMIQGTPGTMPDSVFLALRWGLFTD